MSRNKKIQKNQEEKKSEIQIENIPKEEILKLLPLKEEIKKEEYKSSKINRHFLFFLVSITSLILAGYYNQLLMVFISFCLLIVEIIYYRNDERKKNLKLDRLDSRIHLKMLFGSHIALFTHRENNQTYILGKSRVNSLQECVRIKDKELAYKIDTTKPTLNWGGIRLYLIDCENSQQISLKENEKVINKKTINDFVYRESLYKFSKSVNKGKMQKLEIILGFIMGMGIMGLILMTLINEGVL